MKRMITEGKKRRKVWKDLVVILLVVSCMGVTACGSSSGGSDTQSNGSGSGNQKSEGQATAASNEIEGEYTMTDDDGVDWRLDIEGTHFELYGTKTNANNQEVVMNYSGPVVTNEEGSDHTGNLEDPAYLFILGGGRFTVTVDGEAQTAGDELYDKLSGVLDAEDFAKPKIQVKLDPENGTFSLVNKDDVLHVGQYWE